MKARNEIDPKFQWDFTDMFKDQAAWEAAYGEAEKEIETLSSLKGTLGESARSLKKGLDTYFAAARKLDLVYNYASLHKSSDNGDDRNQVMESRAVSLYVKFSTVSSFMEPEIVAIPGEKLAEYMKDKDLALYSHFLEDIDRGRAHTLDEGRERMLAMLGDAAQTPSNAFSMFESVDMTFPDVHDEEGNASPLTHGTFGVYRESKKQAVREEAFKTYFGEFERYKNTLAALYAGSVKMDNFSAAAKGFGSACEAALFRGNVPMSVYDSLVEAVHDSLPSMRKYIEMRKKRLGLEELHLYDLYNPIMESVEIKVDLEEAKRLVKEATKPLGEGYARLIDEAFANRWMDVYENKGKTTGAFSCGVYDAHPYVLLNFTDTLDDAFTMAHELGHAMHSYLSSKAQEYCNSDYMIMVAEVASTVNEVLLTKYLLSVETDPHRRAYILNHFLEGFRTTVYRQTLFAEFERKAHEMDQAGVPLTAQSLSQVYHELNSLYYEGCVIDDFTDIEWARIPHFYNAYYVYQYATGFSSAVAIAQDILSTGDPSRYLKFLSTGGSDYPLEELKIAGVDLTRPESVRGSLKAFDEAIDELAELLKTL